MKTPEKKVKDDVVKHLKFAKAYYCMPVQVGLGRNNMLDVIACVPTAKSCPRCGEVQVFGQFVSIETKADGRKLTARQLSTVKAVKKAEGVVYVVRGNKKDARLFTWEAQ